MHNKYIFPDGFLLVQTLQHLRGGNSLSVCVYSVICFMLKAMNFFSFPDNYSLNWIQEVESCTCCKELEVLIW